ncbi:undecaprenyl-phosphate glucose phosphotransferase [Parafilimonas terrae]|uniref:Putative colanic acid biosysnthesis UDP-glucose lipid carrier transferase n=1 Tax=Parafilimonas terrae TaxID=1465490 RepID=A0A1I5VLD5_9BACT|nr:undecaprenyl-phosphate glucose phosphotransferase [Parafilimonas terrae]SFQ08273.1 putative colanic acid biosysnthesis UDP-glucose lipid carrier transferase [Parafilimonas terrae]
MGNKEFQFLRSVLLLTDFVLINLAATISILISYNNYNISFFVLSIITVNVSWLCIAYFFRLYTYNIISEIERTYRQSWRVLAVQILFLYGLMQLINYGFFKLEFLNRTATAYFVTAGFFVLISRFFQTYLAEFFLKNITVKTVPPRRIAIIGYNDKAQQLAEYFHKNDKFYELLAFFSDGTGVKQPDTKDPFFPIKDCVNYAVENKVREIYSTVLPSEHPELPELVKKAEANMVRLRFVAAGTSPANAVYNLVEVDKLNQMSIMALRNEPLDIFFNRVKKRAFDIIVSSLVIIFVMSWLTPLLGILIKLSSKGPVFFIQDRSGKDNKTFRCMKFRSMAVNKDSDYKQAKKNDSRITKIGAFMRKTSLDEFPQFFNVFMGDMSLCGPRPHMLKHTEEYSKLIEQYMIRHFLKPGVTGWAQINGYRGETSNPVLMEKRVEHDIWYMENWSLMLDIRIIFLTIFNIFKGEENAY